MFLNSWLRISVLGETGAQAGLVALGLCAVTLAGCSSSQITTTATPTPVSSTVYQDKLRSANIAVAAAMDRFATARSPEQTRTGLEQAFGAVQEAARLLEINPPVEVQAVHRDLLAGLQQLTVDLSHLRDQAMSKTLCAGPSVVAAVSNGPGMIRLRSVRDVLGSGRAGVSYQWGDSLPAPMQLPERRLVNGQLIDTMQRGGKGQLRVDNGTGHDAVVELVQDGKPVVSVYVATGLNTTVDDINDGSYELFYTSGTDWDGQLETFTRSCSFKRFQTPVNFTTTPIEGGAVRSTTQVVGLRDQAGGERPNDGAWPVVPKIVRTNLNPTDKRVNCSDDRSVMFLRLSAGSLRCPPTSGDHIRWSPMC